MGNKKIFLFIGLFLAVLILTERYTFRSEKTLRNTSPAATVE